MPVAAPADHVFALLTDPRRLPEWQVEVTEAEVLGGGPVATGARIREVRRVAGRALEQVVRVAVHEPPHRFGLRIEDGRVPIHGDWRLVPDGDDRTLVRVRAFGELPRPQDPAITRAVLDAALALIGERGFSGVSMEDIAAAAGVGKPAIYRRFATKADVVVAAITEALPPMAPAAPARSDDEVRDRLRQLVEQATPEDPQGYAGLIGGLMADRRRHPEPIAAFRERVLGPRRAAVRAAVEDAQGRGVLRAEVDPGLAVDLLGGAFLARASAGLPMTPAWRAELFDAWWRALA